MNPLRVSQIVEVGALTATDTSFAHPAFDMVAETLSHLSTSFSDPANGGVPGLSRRARSAATLSARGTPVADPASLGAPARSRNKGRISLESTVGQGTIFFLDFPAAPAPAPALATPARWYRFFTTFS